MSVTGSRLLKNKEGILVQNIKDLLPADELLKCMKKQITATPYRHTYYLQKKTSI